MAEAVALQSLTQFWAGGLEGLNCVDPPLLEELQGKSDQALIELLVLSCGQYVHDAADLLSISLYEA